MDLVCTESWYSTCSSNDSGLWAPQDGPEEEAPVRVLMKADASRRESLQAEAEVDPMDGEQTWPTDTELLEAEGRVGGKGTFK